MKKYKVTAIVTTEFETEASGDFREESIKFLDKLLPPDLPFAIHAIKKIKRSGAVLGEFTPEEIFPYVTDEETYKEYIAQDTSYKVRMNSLRYRTFKRNPVCACCGLVGVKFLLELPCDAHSPHFNFYGVKNGKLIMMTRDHIIPKSKGGQETLENMQTMCVTDNGIKDSCSFTMDEIRELKTIRNMVRRGITEKDQAKLFKELKNKILSKEVK